MSPSVNHIKIAFCVIFASSIVALNGCDQNPQVMSASTGQMPARTYDREQMELGLRVYRQYCAVCHGENAEGTVQWRNVDVSGNYTLPLLNGVGHAWHHSRQVLRDVINNGSRGSGNMPAWREILTGAQVEAVIDWIQSLWPDPVYAAWYETHQR